MGSVVSLFTVNRGIHKCMDMVSNKIQVGCGILTILNWYYMC